jgi:hypothetical protein
VFVRSKFAFSDHHDFDEWPALGKSIRNKVICSNSLLAYYGDQVAIHGMKDIPDWVDFIEVLSVGTDFQGYRPPPKKPYFFNFGDGSKPALTEDDDFFSIDHLTSYAGLRTEEVAPYFDQRLIVFWMTDEATPEDARRAMDQIRKALGKTARPCWHSEEIFGLVFQGQASPKDIMHKLDSLLDRLEVYEAGVFKVAGFASEAGVPSAIADAFPRLVTSPRK